jgi:hypothetical protein
MSLRIIFINSGSEVLDVSSNQIYLQRIKGPCRWSRPSTAGRGDTLGGPEKLRNLFQSERSLGVFTNGPSFGQCLFQRNKAAQPRFRKIHCR